MTEYHSERVICTICKGKGVQVHDELTNYHKGEYSTSYSVCHKCEGSGMLLKKTQIDYEPAPTLLPLA